MQDRKKPLSFEELENSVSGFLKHYFEELKEEKFFLTGLRFH